MLDTFKTFMADDNAWDMFVTGAAGTGKTTSLGKAVAYCMQHDIPYVVCAYTHKACSVLASKLPPNANIATLHSWLKKRPGINEEAKRIQHVQVNTKMGNSERPRVVFIDEYSIVGEKDLMDVRSEQDNNYEGIPDIKVVWLGDPHQLPPVGDQEAVRPYGQYSVVLDKVYRQAEDSEIMDTLKALISYIEGKPVQPLKSNRDFIRGVDIVNHYKDNPGDNVILAYTNKRVQELNAKVQGYTEPQVGDKLFCPTTRQTLTYHGIVEPKDVDFINLPFGEDLHLHSKYKTLEFLLESKLAQVGCFTDEDNVEHFYAFLFGHNDYKEQMLEYKKSAASSNLKIQNEFPGVKAKGWAQNNATHPLARKRAKAWREFMTFSDCVVCLDFPHAMTVHKSQGSTFDTVYVDMDDLAKCADTNLNLYLRLTYVALSRTRQKVYSC